MITITFQDDVDLFRRIITIIYTIANVLKYYKNERILSFTLKIIALPSLPSKFIKFLHCH
jgi:hypothetical protein